MSSSVKADSAQIKPPPGRRMLCAAIVVAASASLTLGSIAVASAPEDGRGGRAITVTPSDGLPAAASVQVSGSGFAALEGIELAECPRLAGTDAWRASGPLGRDSVLCARDRTQTTADANGDFGPVTMEVTRTFATFSFPQGEPTTYTCLAQDDCLVAAFTSPTPGKLLAWHHLSFAD